MENKKGNETNEQNCKYCHPNINSIINSNTNFDSKISTTSPYETRRELYLPLYYPNTSWRYPNYVDEHRLSWQDLTHMEPTHATYTYVFI